MWTRCLLLPLIAILLLSSCKKETAVTNKTKSQASSGSQYPTVDEEHLKGVVRTQFDSPNPTKEQLERRSKNNKLIKDMGLPVFENLPVVEDEKTVKLRTPHDVAASCLATTICAVKADTQDQQLIDDLVKQYAASSYFSPDEKRYIDNPSAPRQDQINMTWQYECAHVFLWALQARGELAAPDKVCPVAEDLQAIKKIDPAGFVSKARLRPTAEILDMADLYYRLDWAAVDMRVKGRKSEKIDEQIIRERHRALNWLIRYMNQDWDDVKTDT